MRAARGRGARAGLGRAVQAVGAGQLARPRAEGGRLPRPGLVTQTCRGLGGRGEVLGDLDVAVGGHLVLEQQRLPPLLGQGSLPRGAAACTGVTVEAAPGPAHRSPRDSFLSCLSIDSASSMLSFFSRGKTFLSCGSAPSSVWNT